MQNYVNSTVIPLFEQIRDSLLCLDPVAFCEKYLTLDGKPFRLNGNGYKPFADIYRYIGVVALEKNAKPIVLVKGRQVGATTMAAALELYFMTCGLFGNAGRAPIRIMHCFPQLELAFAYSKTKLNTMISSSIEALISTKRGKRQSFVESKLDTSTATNDSLQFKQFEGGNHIFIESTGLTADRLRSRTVDAMFFDEVQDMRGTALGNAIKILAKAQYGKVGDGVQVYFGTPKQRGTEYWKIWNNSSQQYYHLGCEKCGDHFPLYTPGTSDWEKIWIEDNYIKDDPRHGFVVKCTHCGHEQDKRDAAEHGRWVAYNKSGEYHERDNPNGWKFVGYHINQLYMPEFSREKIISEKPENHPINTERAFQNEILGEFFAGDAAPITPEEIDALHKDTPDQKRKFRTNISIAEKKKVYLGCDWGQKADIDQLTVGDSGKRQQGQSYSCAVVLVPDGPHILNIEFATRLKRNDLESKKGIVEQMFRQYSVNLAVGDIGYANDLTEILQKEYGERFLASQSASRVNGHTKFKNDFFPSTIVFEKDYYIAELYGLMKEGRIRFPYGDFEKVGWLIQHCCSMEIKPTIDRSGETGIRYVKGSTPNDGFMALLNAYLAYKFDVSNGFEITNPNQMNTDPQKRKQIPAITGFLPRFNPLKR